MWRIWCKAIGDKAVKDCNNTSDLVAYIRTGIIVIYLITNLFIIAGILHHW